MRLLIALTIIMMAPNLQAEKKPCLKVGIISEFSTGQSFGHTILRGALTAQDLNKGQCVEMKRFEFDNLLKIPRQISNAKAEGFNLLVGLGSSKKVELAKKQINLNKMVLISPTASKDDLNNEKSSRIVLVYPRNSSIAQSIAQKLIKLKKKQVGVVYAYNSPYSRHLYSEFQKEFERLGGKVKPAEKIRSGFALSRTQVKKIKESGTTEYFVPLFDVNAAKIVSQLYKNKVARTFVGADSWGLYLDKIAKIVESPEDIQVLLPKTYDAALSNRRNREFVNHYKKKYGEAPDDQAAYSFDAVNLALKMARKCGIQVPKWRVGVCLNRSVPFSSVLGDVQKSEQLSLQRNVPLRKVKL